MSGGIRAALEARLTSNSRDSHWWLLADEVYVDEPANRLLFAVLAGEPTIVPIDPPVPVRGLPNDVTSKVKASHADWRASTTVVNWVSYRELVATVEQFKTWIVRNPEELKSSLVANQIGTSIDAILSYLAVFEANYFETRLIFWMTPI